MCILFISLPFRHIQRIFLHHLILSPIQGLEPGATPCRGGRCATRYPRGPPAAVNKNT